ALWRQDLHRVACSIAPVRFPVGDAIAFLPDCPDHLALNVFRDDIDHDIAECQFFFNNGTDDDAKPKAQCIGDQVLYFIQVIQNQAESDHINDHLDHTEPGSRIAVTLHGQYEPDCIKRYIND